MYDGNRRYYDPRIETMDLKEIKILQERRLRQVVEHVYSRSIFYRKKFDKLGLKPKHIKTLKDITKIPITDKYEMRESYEHSVNEGKRPFAEIFTLPEEKVVAIHSSSGTTGVPFSLPFTEMEYTSHGMLATGDSAARLFWAAGIRPGDVLAHMWNLGGAMVGGGNHIIGKGACIPELFVTVIPCHVGRTEKILQMLKDVKVDAIFCTPSYASYLPEMAKKLNVDVKKDLHLKTIVTGGEPGGASVPGLRNKLRELWDVPDFDAYGGPGVWLTYECECHCGFHTHSDGSITEVINPETKEQVPDGEYGSLVGTGLGLAGFPSLRFNNEDRGAVTQERCECGRTHPRILSVPGRWDDVVKIKGYQLHPNAVEKIVGETKGCTGEFLIILEKDEELRDHVSIKVEHEPDMTNVKDFREDLQHAIRVVITLRADVEMVPKGTLGRYVMKKHRMVDLRSKEKKEKYEENLKLRSADYFE